MEILPKIMWAVLWLVIAHFLGKWGESRRIGYWPAFITGLLFLPLSIILILVLGPKEEEKLENPLTEAIEEYQKKKVERDQAILNQFKSSSNLSLTEKLEQLKQMKADGLLNEQDYNNMKTNLLTGKGF